MYRRELNILLHCILIHKCCLIKMDGTKLELTNKPATNENVASYKPIPERDVEGK